MVVIFVEGREWQSLVATINGLKASVKRMEDKMTATDDAIAALGTQVSANTSAEASAATLLSSLSDLIKANATDPTKVTDLATRLKVSADALAAAIVANTPSA